MIAEQLRERVVRQFGAEVLKGRDCEWHELDDGAPALVVDDVMFSLSGEDLHVTGPIPGGRVVCAAYAPDGTHKGNVAAPDPFSAEQAAMN